MLGIELTERQKKIWGDMGDLLLATSQIRHLALQYYIQYRQNLIKNKLVVDDVQGVSNLIHIAFFISQKNQITFNMRGERVGGVAFSINQIIKNNKNFQDFIYHMKQMLKVVTISDKFVEQQIESCLKKFKFTMTFHHKFVSTFKKINPSPSQPQLVQSLLWLVFISAKQNLSVLAQNDIIQVTCLIATVFIFYIEQLTKINGSQKQYELDDTNYGGRLKKQAITHVFLQYFRIKDFAKYQQVSGFFRDQILGIKQHVGFQLIFNDKNLQSIYRKLDSLYMKKINESNIDERQFLKQRINTVMNANRFTPFGGRRNLVKNKNSNLPSHILSHRVLNYQKQQLDQRMKNADIQNEQNKETAQKNGSILLKRLAQNKTPAQRTPLIKATPMTNAMQMYNWVLEKSSYHKFDAIQIGQHIKCDQKILKLVNGLWKDICLSQVQKGITLTQKQKMSLLALSVQIVFFVTNSSQNFQKIVSDLQLNWVEVWTSIDCVLNYDSRMPISIKIHLLSLDTVLISKQLWQKQQSYASIFKDQRYRCQKPEMDRLYRRVIHQIVYQIYFLCKRLNLNQQAMNSIFFLSQHVLCQQTQLLFHRTLYHIVLCSTYAIFKAQNIQIKFTTILHAFQQMNNMSKQDYHQLVQLIYAEGKDYYDIIIFYNQQFVKRNKTLLHQIKQIKTANTYQAIPNKKNLINSPVKQLLPKNLIVLGDRTNKSLTQTPLTLALQAYHQSPLLKERKIKNLANYIDGKRLLQKKNQFSKQQSLKQTSMLINQKWRNTKSPQQRLNTTIKKGTHLPEQSQRK